MTLKSKEESQEQKIEKQFRRAAKYGTEEIIDIQFVDTVQSKLAVALIENTAGINSYTTRIVECKTNWKKVKPKSIFTDVNGFFGGNGGSWIGDREKSVRQKFQTIVDIFTEIKSLRFMLNILKERNKNLEAEVAKLKSKISQLKIEKRNELKMISHQSIDEFTDELGNTESFLEAKVQEIEKSKEINEHGKHLLTGIEKELNDEENKIIEKEIREYRETKQKVVGIKEKLRLLKKQQEKIEDTAVEKNIEALEERTEIPAAPLTPPSILQ